MTSFLTDQERLHVHLVSQALPEHVIVLSLEGNEHIGKDFSFTVHFYVKNALDITCVLGKACSIVFFDSQKNVRRVIHGMITFIEEAQSSDVDEWVAYALSFSSFLFALNMGRTCQVFQKQSSIDIIKTVLTRYHVDYEFLHNKSYDKIDYYVQYNQTPFMFMQRLMEEQGLFYFFTHDAKKHALIISDNNQVFSQSITIDMACNTTYAEQILYVREKAKLCLARLHLMDYNYEKPGLDLFVKSKNILPNTLGEDYIYPGGHDSLAMGERQADIGLEANETSYRTIYGKSQNPSLAPGHKVTLKNHPIKKDFIILKTVHFYSSKTGYTNEFEGFYWDIPYRMPLETERPKITGTQTAVVTGAGNSIVYGDRMGRIKIRFFWDIHGVKDENSSLWVRVMEQTAGNQFGFLFTPRVGMEVVVMFLEGDPNRPLVIGSVYHQNNLPIYSMIEDPYYSGIRTKSFKGDGFHELRFSDKADEEEIYAFSKKDWNTVVTHKRTETIMLSDDILVVKKGNKSQTLEGQKTFYDITIKDGDYRLSITQGNQHITLNEGNITIKQDKGDATWTLNKGDYTLDVSGNITIKASKNMTIDVGETLTIKAKNINVSADQNIDENAQMNYTLKAMEIMSSAQTNATYKAGANLNVEAEAACMVKAGVSLNMQAVTIMNNASATFTAKASLVLLG